MLKKKRYIGFKRGLISLGGEVIVSLAKDQVGCQFTLSKQRVGGNVTAGDVDFVEYLRKHPNFIGLLDLLVALYGQDPDFFWV
jgi:hypothetical protein